MQNQTRKKYNQFLARIAEVNSVSDATQKFNVTPSIEQKLLEKVQDSDPFLRAINNITVTAQEGEKVYIGVKNTIASRIDTSDGETERKPQAVSALSSQKYRCEQTNFDTYVRYATLDAWSDKPDFQRLLRLVTSKQIARDRLIIGFNGTHAATTTNRSSNPMLQDVNKGWLQHIKDQKPSVVMDGLKIGNQTGKDYANADAAVFDLVNTLVEPWHRDNELVVICGRKMLTAKYFHLISNNDTPLERKALEDLMLSKSIGALRTLAVPFFPADALLITKLSNLSIYTQRGSTRLAYFDNPKLDRIEEFRSVNESYVVEDYDACALLTGIKVPNADGSDWE
ncbi:phage major capsid protein, P2 family [Dichelobacter nodosus]|uniref:phage major capsid protein, P2 family n=1 Tax=Dichelobacter nodosus TaxID=870 RepID=UPI00068007B1|nr:phage major capsid protein, P2 family [Dichelobacter nodosus]KNZ39969.1 capsid protein [Dichelobacter nodosus]